MIGMTVREIAQLLDLPEPASGGDAVVTSAEFDTRRLRPGALFVALTGTKVDGHDFVGAAAQAGAVAVLGSHRIPGCSLPVLTVADDTAVQDALATLARHQAGLLIDAGLVVVGVTGSSGKTSTKDLIAAVLARGCDTAVDYGTADDGDGVVVAPQGSFNNELGHPYTVLRATPATRFLVLELSARGPGHIAHLAAIAPPRIGAVLNVGSAHLGEFGSVEQIARAKGELVEALPADGIAVLNLDDGRVAGMAGRTRAEVVTAGRNPTAQVRADDLALDDLARASFTLVTPQGTGRVQLKVAGEHQVGNALTAAAIGLAAGIPFGTVVAALNEATPASKWRMEVTVRDDGVTVVNDAYNANPESMRAALRSLAVMGAAPGAGRTWAVLGPMGELGDDSRRAHDEVGRLAVRLGVAQLLVVGEPARALHLGACLEGSFDGESRLVADIDEALEVLRDGLRPSDVVLVKASRAAGLDRIATALLTPPTQEAHL